MAYPPSIEPYPSPSMSQTSTELMSKVFVDPSGSPIPVHVQGSGIPGRPRLMRTLRNAGAHICHYPSQSQIILVDSSTNQGRLFIREWGSDNNRVVVEDTWVNRSIDEGRPLLEGDNWGGCKAVDDGKPINDRRHMDGDMDMDGDMEEEQEQQSTTLPTPRPTPTEFRPSKSTQGDKHRASKTPGRSSHTPQQSQSAHRDTSSVQPSNTPSQPQPLVPSRSPMRILSQPAPPSQSIMPPPSQPLMPPPSQTQDVMQQPFLPQQPQYQMLDNQHMQQILLQGMAQHQLALNGRVFPPGTQMNYDSDAFKQIMVDVLRQGVMNQMNMGMGTQGWNSNNQMPSSQGPFEQNQNVGGALYPSENGAIDPTNEGSPGPRSSSPNTPPPPATYSSSSKGKMKATSNGRPRKHSPVAYSPVPSSSPSSSRTYESPSRFAASSQELRASSPKATGDIFKSKTGKSLTFFVQIDLKRRNDVVQALKKNSGKITPNIPSADYVILSNNRSTTFSNLLRQTLTAGKQPLQPTFVHDCVQEGALLESESYVLEGTEVVAQKRGRPINVSKPKFKVKEEMEMEKRLEKEKKLEKEKRRIEKKVKKEKAASTYVGPPSPSPPPETSRVEHTGGKFLYTPEERAYVAIYTRFLLQRDPMISNTSIAQKLYHKMPHHPESSWNTFFMRNTRDEVARIRKEVAIAQRKAMVHREVTPLLEENRVDEDQVDDNQVDEDQVEEDQVEKEIEEQGPSKKPRLDVPTTIEPSLPRDDTVEQEDFEIICQFFASGGGDDDDDEAVWTALANHKQCRTAPTWPEFYQTRMGAINDHIEELVRRAESGATTEVTRSNNGLDGATN